MAGKPNRSGGHNARTFQEHQLAGTFRPSRHSHLKAAPAPAAAAPISSADRRRTLRGLKGEARRIVANLLSTYDGWDASSLTTLRDYGRSCARLDELQAAAGTLDVMAVHREVRTCLALRKSLNLENIT